MAKLNNPAGRLYEILSEAQNRNGGTTRLQLAEIFQIHSDDTQELLRRMNELIELVNDAERSLRELTEAQEIDSEDFLAPFPHIRATLNDMVRNLSSNWDNFKRFGPDVLTSLRLSSSLLSKFQPEDVIDEQELKGFAVEVDTLNEKVMASSLETELKTVILDQLEIIRRAISEYRIGGTARLREALEISIGKYALNREIIEQHSDVEEVKGLKKVLFALGRYTWTGLKYAPLAERAVRALLE
jgi:hypothetical protein